MLRNEEQRLRNNSQVIKDKLYELGNEEQTLRNNFQVIRDELRELKNKAHVIKNNSQVLRNEEQELRDNFQVVKDKLHKHRNEIKSLKNNFQVIIDKLHKLENEADVLIDNDKKNKVVDQVNLTAKIRIDYLKNVNEIIEIMNELHDYDDPHLRLFELNRINALLDKSLDYAWELSHSGNREKHKIIIDKDMCLNRYSDIINDKLDLVNGIGELIDSYMADAYNIVDGINKSHNNSLLYDILAEDLKNCKDTILKMINSSSVCAKQDTKKTDADNATVCDKQDTNNDKLILIIMINQILK